MIMKEKALSREIARIAQDADSLSAALNRIQFLLAAEWGGALLIIRPVRAASTAPFPPKVCEFLDSRDFPFRGLYTAPLETGAASAGTLMACIGSWGAPGEAHRTIANFAGQQLTYVLRRLAIPLPEYAEAA